MSETVEHGDALGRVLERLDALEAENARLTAEIAALQGGQPAPAPAPAPADPADGDGPARGWTDAAVSRRQALRALGGAAAAGAGLAIAGGALTAEPAAATTGTMHYGGTLMDAQGDYTQLISSNGNETFDAENYGDGNGIDGIANDSTFPSRSGTGVYGVAGGQSGLAESAGVMGDTNIQYRQAVLGVSTWGHGVRGVSGGKYPGGFNTPGGAPLPAGVVGETTADGAHGVRALSTNGPGLFAQSGGVGAVLYGNTAPVVLQPVGPAGPPSSGNHSLGEVYPDGSTLWYCTRGGFPGTWVRLLTNGVNTLSGSGTAVEILSTGTGIVLEAQNVNASNGFPVLYGLTNGTGPAVKGYQSGKGQCVLAQVADTTNANPAVYALTNGPGPAVQGAGSANGRGAKFSGGAAQMQLTPSTASGPPASGQAGDLFVDASARLWLCTVGGSTATWKQVQVA